MLSYRLSRQITCIFLSTAHTSRPSRASFHDHVDVPRLASHVFSRTRRTRYNRDIVTMFEFFASTFRRRGVKFRIVVVEPRNIHRSYSYAAVTVNSAPHRFSYSGSIFHESVSVTGAENTLLIPACRIASNHASTSRIFFRPVSLNWKIAALRGTNRFWGRSRAFFVITRGEVTTA